MKQMKFFGGFFSGWTIPFLLIPLFSIGCTPLPDHGFSSIQPAHPQKLESPLVDWAAASAVGNRAKLTDPAFEGTIRVQLDQEYLAASGLVCKRVRVQQNFSFSEEVPVCRSKKNEWFLAPRIWGHFAGGDGY